MLTFEQAQWVLSDLADQLPAEIFRGLNGGIILLPEIKIHPEAENSQDLYILGQYHYDPRGFGRYITIYYGSLAKTHGNLPDKSVVNKLREVLYHELTHHLEHLAGEKSLEIKDSIAIDRYKRKKAKDLLDSHTKGM